MSAFIAYLETLVAGHDLTFRGDFPLNDDWAYAIAVRRLLEEENVTAQGRFHSFEKVTSLPRPTQKPRPPFWIAARSVLGDRRLRK